MHGRTHAWTHGNSGDFRLCPMLYIADKNKSQKKDIVHIALS